MSNTQLKTIMRKLNYINYPCQIHLHGSGEALICKDLPEKIKLIKNMNPNLKPLIITTLAYHLDKEYFESLFQAGLEFINISLYAYNEENYKIVHGSNNFNEVITNLRYLAEFKNKYNISICIELDKFKEDYPCGLSQVELDKERAEFIKFLHNLGFDDNMIQFRELHTFGNVDKENKFPKYKSDKVCSIINGYRHDILQVDFEGNVIPCCFDMNSSIIWGNIYKHSLNKIFMSKARKNFLAKIKNKEDIELCRGCIEFKKGYC